jgi:hypothetical protein
MTLQKLNPSLCVTVDKRSKLLIIADTRDEDQEVQQTATH